MAQKIKMSGVVELGEIAYARGINKGGLVKEVPR